jgi:hypothetical protein
MDASHRLAEMQGCDRLANDGESRGSVTKFLHMLETGDRQALAFIFPVPTPCSPVHVPVWYQS